MLWILGDTIGTGWASALAMCFLVVVLMGASLVINALRARSVEQSVGMSFVRRWAPTLLVVPVAAAVLTAAPLLLLGWSVTLRLGRPAAEGPLAAAGVLGIGCGTAAVSGLLLGFVLSRRISMPERLAGVLPARGIGAAAGAVAILAVSLCGYGLRDAYGVQVLASEAAEADAWRAAHPELVLPLMGYEVRGERGDASNAQLVEVTKQLYQEGRVMLATPTNGFEGGQAVLVDTPFLASWRPDLLNRIGKRGVTILKPEEPGPDPALTTAELRDMVRFWADLRADTQPVAITEASYEGHITVPLLSYSYVAPGDSFRANPVLVVVPDPAGVLQPVQLATDSAYTDAGRYTDLVRDRGAADVVVGVESIADTSARNASRRAIQQLACLTGAATAVAVAILSTAVAAWALARIRRPQVFLRRCVGDGLLRIHGATIAASACLATVVAGVGALACHPEVRPVAFIAPAAGAVITGVIACVLSASFRSSNATALEEI